jgi:hypothetical protein
MFSRNLLLSYHLVQVDYFVLDFVEESLLFVLCHQKPWNSTPEIVVDPLDHPSQMHVYQIQLSALVGPRDLSFWVVVLQACILSRKHGNTNIMFDYIRPQKTIKDHRKNSWVMAN